MSIGHHTITVLLGESDCCCWWVHSNRRDKTRICLSALILKRPEGEGGYLPLDLSVVSVFRECIQGVQHFLKRYVPSWYSNLSKTKGAVWWQIWWYGYSASTWGRCLCQGGCGPQQPYAQAKWSDLRPWSPIPLWAQTKHLVTRLSCSMTSLQEWQSPWSA